MSKILIAIAVLALCPMAANAIVTVNLFAGTMYGDDMFTPLPLGSTLALVADADMDGFDDLALTGFGYEAAGDALLIAFASNDAAFGPGSHSDSLFFDVAPELIGKDVALVWWNSAFMPAATSPGGNVAFGWFHTTMPIASPWVVPNDGDTVSLAFVQQAFGGDQLPEAGLTTGFTAYPEPASALMLLSALPMALRRRRMRAA